MNKSDLNLDKENIDETYEIDNKVILNKILINLTMYLK